MRTIDADKLMKLYENTQELNIDNFYVPIPVVRQNIIDMPTINNDNIIVLPCKIGDTVWTVKYKEIYEAEVICIRPFVYKNSTEYRGNVVATLEDPFYDDGRPLKQEWYVVFGKDTFLTKEEAELAIKNK